jgi:hypothetical protein
MTIRQARGVLQAAWKPKVMQSDSEYRKHTCGNSRQFSDSPSPPACWAFSRNMKLVNSSLRTGQVRTRK